MDKIGALLFLVPCRPQAAGDEPFIETIRALRRHAGGLRFDHVMGLFRLFWIRAVGGGGGAYVRSRAADLLAIVAFESLRRGVRGRRGPGDSRAGVREARRASYVS